MKHLRIEYTTEGGNPITLFDGEVAEVTWSDGSGVVRVEGKTSTGGMNLLEMLTGGSKARTESLAEEKRAGYEAEKAAKSKAAPKKAAPKPKLEVVEEPVGEIDLDEVAEEA